MFEKILVPTDGSELSGKAVQAAVDFGREKGGKLVGFSMAEEYPYSPLAESAFLTDSETWRKENEAVARGSLERFEAATRAAGVGSETTMATGSDAAEEIVRAADKLGCDAIFMASHGRHGVDRLLLGSVTQKVLLKSKLPVVVFR